MSILSSYEHWASAQPDAPAVTANGRSLSFGELFRAISDPPEEGRRLLLEGPTDERWIVRLLSALAAGREVVLPDTDWSEDQRPRALDALGEPGDEPGVWLYTSGTTAEPQPCFRPLSRLSAMVESLRRRIPRSVARTRPAALSLAPLDHGFGLMNGLFLTHSLGGAVVLPDGPPEETVEKHSVGLLFAWPDQYRRLVESGVGPLPSLSWCVSASFLLDPAVAEAFRSRTGCSIRQLYGITEKGPICVDAEEPPHPGPNCVGTPLEGVEVSVRDGLLRVRTAPGEAWWNTGDTGTVDTAGRVFVTGRQGGFTDERKDLP